MIEKHLELLGKPARDAVTGFSGVVTTIGFDLYGCVQAVITPPVADGKTPDGNWYDVARVKVTSSERVMPVPDFIKGYVAEGLKGAAEKTLP